MLLEQPFPDQRAAASFTLHLSRRRSMTPIHTQPTRLHVHALRLQALLVLLEQPFSDQRAAAHNAFVAAKINDTNNLHTCLCTIIPGTADAPRAAIL